MTNILITNIGRRGYLVDFLKNTPQFKGKIFVSDCDKTASGLYGNNDGYFLLPRVTNNEEEYVRMLLEVCKEQQVGLVIPIIDPEIYVLSEYRDMFLENGIRVVVSTKDVLDICYNKLQMNIFLKENGFCYPKTYDNIKDFEQDYAQNDISFPVILKPIYGSGSAETYKVETLEKLQTCFHEGLVIQEFLDGTEYGVDVFNTYEQLPVRCVIKKKIAMRSGETDKALTVENDQIFNIAIRLAKCLGHIGNLDFDLLEVDGKIYIIDMNPRFGGGYPATHMAGVNLLELLVRLTNGENVEPEFHNYAVHLLVMKEVSLRTKQM